MTILIVDDNEVNLYQLQVLLTGHGYQIVKAANGAEALAKARQNPPNLILTDILMPVMDGFTLCREWMKDERLKGIPLVFYTATYTDSRDSEFGLSLGAARFLVKPEEAEVILRTIREVTQPVPSSAAALSTLAASVPASAPADGENGFLRQYNEVLIRKLEAKLQQLERANRDLEREIAEHKRTELKIRSQAELLDLAHDAIAVRDMNGCVQYWNKGCERLTNWTAAEAVGKSILDLVRCNRAVFDLANRVLLAEGRWSGQLVLARKDGRPVTVMSLWTLVRDDQGQPKSVLVINTDITEQKKLEAQFLRAQRLESVGQLAGGIAHDLNNILTPILMTAALLREELVSEENRSMLDTVERSAQRGADIIKQLLTFARGSEGQKIPIPTGHLIKEMAKLIQETFPKSIALHTAIADNLWMILGDPTQLHQVLLNLCVNARDAMPEGGALTLAGENAMLDDCFVRMASEAKPGPYVILRVSDTGVGIPPEIADKIFDPFFTTKGPEKGTGLGLATVLGIVKNHEGFIEVQSQVGHGTQFTVYLPSAPVSESAAAVAPPQVLPRGRGELVLAVDDEPSIRNAACQTLEKHGYRVLAAADGTEAVALVAKHQPDIQVVLTDMMMPIMDGAATIRTLLRIHPQLKIIASSGAGSKPKLAEIADLPVRAYLQKPYTAQVLLSTLRKVIDGGIDQRLQPPGPPKANVDGGLPHDGLPK